MRKKKVVLQCPCHFTLTGLEALINDKYLSEHLEIVASTSSFERCEIILGSLPTVDILILRLSSSDYSLASLLSLVGERLPRIHPTSKIVLIGDMVYMDVLKRYFSGLRNVLLILDNSTKLDKLQEQLLSSALSYTDRYKVAEGFSLKLSSREWLVLRRLLDGDTPNQIADDLQLAYKTISHHKRAALAKLGIRSLCPLLVHSHNRQIIHHRLQHLTKKNIRTRQTHWMHQEVEP